MVEGEKAEVEPGPVVRARESLLEIDAREAELALESSVAGRMGRTLEPIGQLCGFDWRINVALVGGFAAKEVIVSTLGTALSIGEVDPEETASLSERLASDAHWNPLVAFSLIVFSIFYAPCFVTVVCMVKETGGWKWPCFSMAFNTVFAFLLATAVYQAGQLLGLGS
jgi:ferrous iron transport protein B